MKDSSLFKNTVLLSVGTLLAKGIQFFMILFISYWLSTEQYGMFDVLSTYITLLLPLLSLATGEAVFRFCAATEAVEERTKYITNGLYITSIDLMLCLVVICFLQRMKIVELGAAFALLLVSQLYNFYFQEYLRAIKRLEIYVLNNVLSTCMVAFLSLGFVCVMGMGLQGLLVAHFLGYLTGDLFVIFYTRMWIYLDIRSISRDTAKKIVKYSLPLVPNNISWWILNVSDRQIINSFMGAAANGIYAIANKIPTLYSSIYSTFNVSWQQNVVEKIEDPDRGIYFNRIYNQMMIILFTLCNGLLSVVFIFFQYIFDSKYYEGYIYVPILLAAAICSSQMQFCGGIQIGLKKTYENGITTIVGAVTNLLLNIALIRYLGLFAAAGSTLAANLVVAKLRKIRLRRTVKLRLEKRTWICGLTYLYFSFTVYFFKKNIFWGWLNVAVAAAEFVAFNKEFFAAVINRVRRER